jgi:UDP-N-acetylmuramoyl-tripeptide--D-alanyl-D-alanine ligase
MMDGMLSDLVTDLAWQLLGDDAAFSGVAIDNRAVQPGQLFIALCGERHDGHDFVSDALARGASAAIVSRPVPGSEPLLLVADTQLALGRLAARHRAAWQGRLFAVTGSAGKTTTKEMLAAILAQSAAVHATHGNLNNEIGVPLTLLGLQAEHHSAVLELGAAKPGDIAYLVSLVQPDIAILTNAMPAHLQGFGCLDQVARTKGEIFVPECGHVAVINSDDDYAPAWRQRAGAARVLAFSTSGDTGADVRATSLVAAASGCRFTLSSAHGSCDIQLGVPGVHNVANALAAAAAALAAEVPLIQIKQGLEQFGGVAGRMQLRAGKGGMQLIDDTYNANPQAVRSALAVLAAGVGARVFVLGDMAELGAASERLHREVGAYAREVGVDCLIAVGSLAAYAAREFGVGGISFATKAQLQVWLAEHDLSRDYQVCLVKGSRSAGMEQIVDCLLAQSGATDDLSGAVRSAASAGSRQGAH